MNVTGSCKYTAARSSPSLRIYIQSTSVQYFEFTLRDQIMGTNRYKLFHGICFSGAAGWSSVSRSAIHTLWLHFQLLAKYFVQTQTDCTFVWRNQHSLIFLFHTALITNLNGRCKSRQERQTHGISLNSRPIYSILFLDFQSVTEWILKMCVSN